MATRVAPHPIPLRTLGNNNAIFLTPTATVQKVQNLEQTLVSKVYEAYQPDLSLGELTPPKRHELAAKSRELRDFILEVGPDKTIKDKKTFSHPAFKGERYGLTQFFELIINVGEEVIKKRGGLELANIKFGIEVHQHLCKKVNNLAKGSETVEKRVVLLNQLQNPSDEHFKKIIPTMIPACICAARLIIVNKAVDAGKLIVDERLPENYDANERAADEEAVQRTVAATKQAVAQRLAAPRPSAPHPIAAPVVNGFGVNSAWTPGSNLPTSVPTHSMPTYANAQLPWGYQS